MPVPAGIDPRLATYLEELEQRVGIIEAPTSPMQLPVMNSADLSTSNATTFAFRFVYLSNLNMTAHSNGAHWYRSDTGALIV